MLLILYKKFHFLQYKIKSLINSKIAPFSCLQFCHRSFYFGVNKKINTQKNTYIMNAKMKKNIVKINKQFVYCCFVIYPFFELFFYVGDQDGGNVKLGRCRDSGCADRSAA